MTKTTAVNDNADCSVSRPCVSVADLADALGLDEDALLQRLAGIVARREEKDSPNDVR